MKKPYDFQPEKGGIGIDYGFNGKIPYGKKNKTRFCVEAVRKIDHLLIPTLWKRMKPGDIIEIRLRHLRP